MAVVSALDLGAQDFVDSVWPNGELYIDEEEAFKKALGGGAYSTWWLLKPSVLRNMLSFVKSFGQNTIDSTHPKGNLLGGTFVVKGGEVVYVHKETSTFDNGDAKVLLAAALGKDVKELKDVGFATPRQADAVCDAKDECSAK